VPLKTALVVFDLRGVQPAGLQLYIKIREIIFLEKTLMPPVPNLCQKLLLQNQFKKTCF
jgi:hypothetical protein